MALAWYNHVLIWMLKGHSVAGFFTLSLVIAGYARNFGRQLERAVELLMAFVPK